jgi:YkoY family integral membrane protein
MATLDVAFSDFLTIGLLILLEGLLSADNAMVLAVLVLGLPRPDQRKALRYGIVGAFLFRVLAILLAVYLIRVRAVMLIGAVYLLWLPYQHFSSQGGAAERRVPKKAESWLGMSPFWSTVIKVELTDIVFAVDSILVAVAISNKIWVVITGGILGVIAMRLVIGQLLVLVRRYPPLVDGAFVIIAWVGIKLVLEYLHEAGYIGLAIPKWFSLGVVALIFVVAFVWARLEGPADLDDPSEEAGILADEGEAGRTTPREP